MTILVIGANFVLDWSAQSDEVAVNLPRLTCAGNQGSLYVLKDDPRNICKVRKMNRQIELKRSGAYRQALFGNLGQIAASIFTDRMTTPPNTPHLFGKNRSGNVVPGAGGRS